MFHHPSRRKFLQTSSLIAGAAVLHRAQAEEPVAGMVIGHPEGASAGKAVLAAGGNAVDAIVAAALVAGVVALPSAGIGGYGGHMVLARNPRSEKGGEPASGPAYRIAAIDFNSTAPAAMSADYFKANEAGQVAGRKHYHGWLSAGVPGVLAGLQLALDRHGTRKFPELVQPAIKYAREGFPVSKRLAASLAGAKANFAADKGSAKLFFDKGQTLAEGTTFRNPDLAALLETLAERGSVESFYRGDIAEKVAGAFHANGGCVTAADMTAFRATEMKPLTLDWNGYAIHTSPLTAGGLTVLQCLAALQALGWNGKEETAAAELVECLRAGWHDRLTLLGDPEKVEVPVEKLLSTDHARATAARVRSAVAKKQPLSAGTDGRPAGGTIHLSAVDSQGLTVAMTLTHGDGFGAQVTVDGLGLVLGHGISRFDPRPGRANSIGPGKRPLTNMCPTVVTKDGSPVAALGATGGRRIVNAVACVLAHWLGESKPLAEAVLAPRVHTEGDLNLSAEAAFPSESLKASGYTVKAGTVATLNAIEREVKSGVLRTATR